MSNQGDGRPPEGDGAQQGNTGGHWGGGQQPWTGGQQPWSGQPAQPPSWSTGETGPNVGPTMNNPQSSYYDRFSAASGEGVTIPSGNGRKNGNRGKVLIGIAAGLVIVIAVVVVVALTRGKGKTPTPAASSASSSLPPVTATTWVNPTLAAGARALKDGWVSQIGSPDMPGQYDVPKSSDWKVEARDMIRGYADKNGKVITAMAATSVYADGYCPNEKDSHTATVGLRNVGTLDPTDVGASSAKKFADGIAAGKVPGKAGTLSAAKKITVDEGTIPAVQYTITATPGDPNACEKGKTFEVRTTTFSARGKSFELVTIRMLGGQHELPTSQLEEITSTFRPNA